MTDMMNEIYIARAKRHKRREKVLDIISKTHYYTCSCNSRELAKTIVGRPDGEHSFLYDADRKKIMFNEPHHPFDSRNEIATQPLVEVYSGNENAKRIESISTLLPGLAMADPSLPGMDISIDWWGHIARQLAPVFGITENWNEEVFHKEELSWQEAHIEYAMFDKLPVQNDYIAVKDTNGNIRSLIIILREEEQNVIRPLSFAQNPNYICPLYCYFSFTPSWYLFNTEYLKIYPHAEIIITNELSVVLGNTPDRSCIFLGYFFGKGMIPFLHLECLYKRNISLFYMETCDEAENRENLEEIFSLLSRFTEMGMKVELLISTARKSCSSCKKTQNFSLLKGHIYLEEEEYTPPLPVSKATLIQKGMNKDLIIPDNIRLETFGKIRTFTGKYMIEDLLASGRKTVFALHENIDILSFSSVIVNAICHEKELFGGKWTIKMQLQPVIFIPASQSMDFADKSGTELPVYNLDFPQEKTKIEHHLNAIRREEDCNILIFLLPEEYSLKQPVLEAISLWAYSRHCGILFLCSIREKLSASRRYTFKRIKSDTITYAVEEDAPFDPHPEKFKLQLENSKWQAKELTEEERKELLLTETAEINYSKSGKLLENSRIVELRNKI